MDKYYVSGCKGQDDDIVTCDDSEAEFWTIYQRMSDGTSQGIIDLKFREDAAASMKVYVERDALQQKLDAVLAENVELKERETRLLKNIHEDLQDTDFYLAKLQTPATDTILNAVRAEGVDLYAQELRRQQGDAVTTSEHRHTRLGRAAVFAEEFANKLRAGNTEGATHD